MAKELGELLPAMMENFGAAGQALMEGSDLDPKTIELLILAFGIAKQCDACIDHHVGILVDMGATENEIATVAGVGVIMAGGPGSAYGAKALKAFYDKKDQ